MGYKNRELNKANSKIKGGGKSYQKPRLRKYKTIKKIIACT